MTSSSVPPIGEPPASLEAATTPATGASTASGSSAAVPRVSAGAAGTSTAGRTTGRSRPDNEVDCVIAHDIETVSVTYCNDPGCPHYRQRTRAECFDRGRWKTASFVPAEQLQGAVSRVAELEAEVANLRAEKRAHRAVRDELAAELDRLGGQ
jgi:hypothetical protein